MNAYELSSRDFYKFKTLVYDKCGINLGDGKLDLVRARLSKRLRQLDITSFSEYYKMVVKDTSGDELTRLMDAISTNLTSFFREKKHFDFLETKILPEHIGRKTSRTDTFKVWSAGCSSGEEPYSIAICLNEFSEQADAPLSYGILATDISTKVLGKAKNGIYEYERLSGLLPCIRNKYFLKGSGSREGFVKVKPLVNRSISFKRFNLMDPFPYREKFNLIFCRNVMIYFDKPTQERLVKKYYESLIPGGYLFIGHSESLMGISHSFQYIQPTIYLKKS